MVDPDHVALSITRQCRLVSIARSSFYYEGTGESPLNLQRLRRIDEQFLETPFYGSRQMTRLRDSGFATSRKDGVRRIYSVQPQAFKEIDRWLERFRHLWEPKLDALATEIARGKKRRRNRKSSR